MTVYDVQEMPSIDDPDLIRNCVCVQEMRRTLVALFQHALSQLTVSVVTTAVRVTLAIMDRLAEGALSVELLCQKNRTRDAAILLLSLHELRLDLQYIALDRLRARIWLDHTVEKKKPWTVSSQIKEIYIASNEQDAEFDLYRRYSMIKHGNPMGENLTFGISAKRDALLLESRSNNNPMVRVHVFALGAHIHLAADAAANIWASEGLDVDGYADTITGQWRRLSKYNEDHIVSVIHEL